MKSDNAAGRTTVSFEELAYTNMMVVEALVELLTEKGVLGRAEIEARIKRVKAQTKVNFVRKQ